MIEPSPSEHSGFEVLHKPYTASLNNCFNMSDGSVEPSPEPSPSEHSGNDGVMVSYSRCCIKNNNNNITIKASELLPPLIPCK
jgi:hypothetical protein